MLHLRISTSLLVFLLILGFLSSGIVEGFGNGATRIHSLDKGGVGMKMNRTRKLLLLDDVSDYDYAGPNSKHDPSGEKPGNGGGRNP